MVAVVSADNDGGWRINNSNNNIVVVSSSSIGVY